VRRLIQAGKVRYAGHSTWPVSAIVEAQWTAADRNRERFRSEQPPYSVLTRAIENDVLPTCARYGMGVIPTARWPGAGCPAVTARTATRPGPPPRPGSGWPTASTCRCWRTSASWRRPSSSRRWPGKAGLTLIELAIAFVLPHPAVTAAIIGPRSMEHLESQLPAADVHLPDDVLDEIDTIVPPGVTLNPADNGWVSPALSPAARRR
jgi:aryl-alcohol dehydrogenase-like predicted oxidoreductase